MHVPTVLDNSYLQMDGQTDGGRAPERTYSCTEAGVEPSATATASCLVHVCAFINSPTHTECKSVKQRLTTVSYGL